jgi:hypothetical protein
MKNRQLPSDEALLKSTLDACECTLVYDYKKLPGPPREANPPKTTFWVVGCCVTELEFCQYFAPKGLIPPTLAVLSTYGMTEQDLQPRNERNDAKAQEFVES